MTRSRILTQRRIIAAMSDYAEVHGTWPNASALATALSMHPASVRRCLLTMHAKGMVLQNGPYAPYRPNPEYT